MNQQSKIDAAAYESLLNDVRTIYNEVDCRIEHGASSSGHLEYVKARIEGIITKNRNFATEPSQLTAANETIKAQREEIERLKAAGDRLVAFSPVPHQKCQCPACSTERAAITEWQQLTKKGE
jgi:DNA repair ATPase RecN